MSDSNELFKRRRQRNRTKLRKTANNSVRLSVHRSSKHIYAQVIDDAAGKTLVSASSLDADFKSETSKTSDIAAATAVGSLVAQRAKAKG